MLNSDIPGVPEGWEIVRIGNPAKGDQYLTWAGDQIALGQFTLNTDALMPTPVAIVQRKAHWQKLWPHQWKETPVQGRFRNHKDSYWEYGTVVQYRPGQVKWKAEDGRWFQYFEVRSVGAPNDR